MKRIHEIVLGLFIYAMGVAAGYLIGYKLGYDASKDSYKRYCQNIVEIYKENYEIVKTELKRTIKEYYVEGVDKSRE